MLIALRLGAVVAACAATAAAHATTPFDVRYESEAVGIQNTTATFSVGGVETFDTLPLGINNFTTDFGTSDAITGRYSNVQVNGFDQYGGPGGTG